VRQLVVGGYTAEKPTDTATQALFGTSAVRQAVASKLGSGVTIAAKPGVVVVAYKSQVVSAPTGCSECPWLCQAVVIAMPRGDAKLLGRSLGEQQRGAHS
jgi:hypothetical protein